MSLSVGVLAIQGDVRENLLSVKKAIEESGINANVIEVKTPDDIEKLDGLIIPGGESTTIGQLSLVNGSMKIIKDKIQAGMPVLGICAGMILLSSTAKDRIVGGIDQPLLDVLDVKLERNSFGRQGESFESDISLNSIGISKFNGVFIRSPSVTEVGNDVEILSEFDNKIVAVKQGNVIGTSFHPELTQDASLHKYFLSLVNK
ncbi:pyridoxal 5'-phosphate synthase glutaminase subunit PdxT [Nitrosopumilus sp.]|uniref:pyridoxal 5'-phosphate synthase glutaminase subunit PdxT n=1 Tax=Nitrosopumilus sp. TaxID=2024843 RepID=UPI003B5CD042